MYDFKNAVSRATSVSAESVVELSRVEQAKMHDGIPMSVLWNSLCSRPRPYPTVVFFIFSTNMLGGSGDDCRP